MAQHMDALQRADEVRLARAATRRELAGAESSAVARRMLAELLDDPPGHLATLRVVDLLAFGHRMGPKIARKIVRRHRVGEFRVVGQLTERQRLVLARELRGELEQMELAS